MGFVPTVVALRDKHQELKKKTACDLVADAAVESGYVASPSRDTFANSLLASYKRYLENPEKDMRHGNMKLTEEEEDFLVGFLKGSNRHGDSIGKAEILETADVIFPDKSFGKTWYENFIATYKDVLKFGRTKSTSTSRTSTATFDSTMQFIEYLQAHLKSTFPSSSLLSNFY